MDKDLSLTSTLVSWFPMLLLICVWIYFMRQMKGGPANYHQQILEEYRRNNELLTKIVERMDARISRLENSKIEREQNKQ